MPPAAAENIRVLVRARPMNAREQSMRCTKVLAIDQTMNSVTIKKPGPAVSENEITVRTFTFDAVFDCDSKQTDIFDQMVLPLIDNTLEGYNATVFAYGQTGSGKTWTMSGVKDNPGMIPLTFQRIFDYISTRGAGDDSCFLVRASFLELYNEEIRDLLSGAERLPLKEDPRRGVFVKDLSEYTVASEREIDKLMDLGNKHRSVAATLMNATSSRSHSVFQVIIERQEHIDGKDCIRVGKLNLVDLAGSERQTKTGATGERLKEGAKINLSLTILGNVINKLVEGSKHIPYRDSKLTRLLQDSLGGNAKTLMIVACSPASDNYDETLATLRYADRAKQIKNKPKINEDPKDTLIREMREQIAALEQQLRALLGEEGMREGCDISKLPQMQNMSADEIKSIERLKSNLQHAKTHNTRIITGPKLSDEEKQKLDEEQRQIESKLQEKKRSAEQSRQIAAQLARKLDQYKGRLIEQEAIESEDRQKEMELRAIRLQAAEQEKKSRELKRQLRLAEEAKRQASSQVTGMQGQLAELQRQIEEEKQHLAEAKGELEMRNQENARMVDQIRDGKEASARMIRLYQLMLDDFVPRSEQAELEARIGYEEEEEI